MKNLVRKMSMLLLVAMIGMMIVPMMAVYAATVTEYVPVYVDITHENLGKLGTSKVYEFSAGDVITATASCPNEKSVYWSNNSYYMKSKNAAINDDGMLFLGYVWDDEPASEVRDSEDPTKLEVVIPNFEPGTEHILAIEGIGAVDYLQEEDTLYEATSGWIEIKFKMGEEHELDIPEYFIENEDVENLVVTLRSKVDEDKANQNVYELNERVTYYVDYKNGGDDINNPVKVVLNIPLNTTVISADGGIEKDGKITWTFQNGLEKDVAGTKKVILKYDSLSKPSLTAEKIYPRADIYAKEILKDSSSMINYIYKDESIEITTAHVPYMFGDANATTFRPNDYMSRAEGALVLIRIFGIEYTDTKITDRYKDIGETYTEAQRAISAATYLGILNGYEQEDGTFLFKPNDKMTRAEFMKIIAECLSNTAKENNIDGLEVSKELGNEVVAYTNGIIKKYIVDDKVTTSQWYTPYVSMLVRLNMTDVSEENTELNLDNKITRAEAAQLINFATLRAPAEVTTKTTTRFSDVAKNHKLFADIVEATMAEHTFTLTNEGTEIAK